MTEAGPAVVCCGWRWGRTWPRRLSMAAARERLTALVEDAVANRAACLGTVAGVYALGARSSTVEAS
jgi:hypothetical protein